MRRRVALLVLSLLFMMGSGCGVPEENVGYQLYFLANTASGHGAALDTEPYVGIGGWQGQGTQEQEEPTPGELLQALFSGPKTESLSSPFPKGVTVQWWEWDEETDGNLRVGLSEQYGGLTDISLTLADYCIVLTLSQLEGVESVEISSEGHMANYRSHQMLRPDEAVLTEPQTAAAPQT